ncbi:unnamed protein product [Litomosoides sigmodontis]|uniref:C2H2-type domain-containing protein n=1 Tax=Litomosoides sigmodontis TaxID=42156 RepID=A0A3P6U320_LITSI|nr:unnamed protein product [Litomosoides sigmodontis]
MRKKQARPARRFSGGVFPDDDCSPGDSREFLSPTWRSPSSSPSHSRSILAIEDRNDSTGSPCSASAMQYAKGDFLNDVPPLKFPKHESDDFGRCCGEEYARLLRAGFAHHGSVIEQSRRIPANCPVPVNDHHNTILSLFTTNGNSAQSDSLTCENVSRFDRPTESIDSESPLKRLERCVRANSEAGCSTFGLSRSSKPSASKKYALTQSHTYASSMKLRFGHDPTKTSAADALGELSQLVHRIGTAKLPVPATPNKCVSNSIAGNIFTCLKCAQRFDTLDELVLHISTTKHFTRGSIKNFDAVAPWETDRATSSFEKQMASTNFLSLFYARKCLKVPQDLSQKSIDNSF